MNAKSHDNLKPNDFVRPISGSESKAVSRKWIGNDRSARNHHGIVNLDERPLRIHLSWKVSPGSQVHGVGAFELDLHKLLEAQLIRRESSKPGKVRLRFWHGFDDMIYIQARPEGDALPIGQF
jgi:hypothetical protein